MDTENKRFIVVDEEGTEIEMEILFTFDHEEQSYVVYFDPTTESGDVFASKYDEENNLIPIEDDKEWDVVEEVLGAFEDEQED